MFKERHKVVPAVYMFFRRGNDILLMLRQGSGYYDGYYSVPAGHVEDGELPLECLVREASEELDVVVDPKDTELAHTTYRIKHDETGDRVDLFFVVKKWTGDPKINEPHKCDDLQWFSMDSLPENMVPHARTALENMRKGVDYSEFGMDYFKKLEQNK